jgi:predicted enzyme related to lactoylglutathione lyase
MMIVTVTFALGEAFDPVRLEHLAAEAVPAFERVPGLRSKTFTLDPARREAVNVYVWDDAALAQAFFSEALRAQVTRVYGVAPRIDFLTVVAESGGAAPLRRGPARAGQLIYACDIERLARFYEQVLGMQRRIADAEHVVLASADAQLILHALPPQYRAVAVAGSPAEPRMGTAIKPFFSVPDFDAAAEAMRELGGELFTECWQGPGFRVRNGCDCEGNVLQLREWRR